MAFTVECFFSTLHTAMHSRSFTVTRQPRYSSPSTSFFRRTSRSVTSTSHMAVHWADCWRLVIMFRAMVLRTPVQGMAVTSSSTATGTAEAAAGAALRDSR